MKRFLAGLAIYGVGLFALGSVLLPTSSDASHKVWLFCHKPDWDQPFDRHWVKQSGVHLPKYSCAGYTVGWWYWVRAPWPH